MPGTRTCPGRSTRTRSTSSRTRSSSCGRKPDRWSSSAARTSTFAIHLCKGNNAGYYFGGEDYGRLSRRLFGWLTNFDVFLLEYDDERSGGFEPLADCPDDKLVVLGLVSTKLPELEAREELAARVEEATRYHPRDLSRSRRSAASPRCSRATR
jgi:5-methyltetrahydropteroyltriglutamate--homocysteine methyltransferase